MYTLIVKDKFDAAHRLGAGYTGKCSNVHGHTYHVEVRIVGKSLNSVGMVADFKHLKRIIHAVVDSLDHNFLTPEEFNPNPTAEVLAEFIFSSLKPLIPVESVTLWETENCAVRYTEGEKSNDSS